MNNKFENNIISIYGDKGKQWLVDLPNIVANIAKEWNLSNLKPVDNLSINYVLSGKQATQEIILKLSLSEDLIFHEKTALTALADFGAVEVLAYSPRTLLLKKLSPATSLKTYLPDRRIEALKIACEITKQLHQAPLLERIKLPTIEERLLLLDNDWPIPNYYLTKARTFRDKILNNFSPRVILHGDLHHDNILSDGNRWKVIDPHGVIGLSLNEVWAFVQDVREDLPFIAKYFNFNLADLKKCYFMHAVLSAVWSIEDNMDPKPWLIKAERLEF